MDKEWKELAKLAAADDPEKLLTIVQELNDAWLRVKTSCAVTEHPDAYCSSRTKKTSLGHSQ